LAGIGAGARSGDLSRQLFQHDLAIPTGTCPSVGIAGLTLGGGLGILGRAHGLTLDQLLAAQVVKSDGRVVDCDEDHDSDLFWALRGAGAGNFGVVTSFTFRPMPAPRMTNFHFVWASARTPAVIAAWQRWAPQGPEQTPHGEVTRQGYRYTKSEFFSRPLPGEAIAALINSFTAHRVGGQIRSLGFAPWGGAYNRRKPQDTAFVHRDQLFLLEHLVLVDPNASSQVPGRGVPRPEVRRLLGPR